jgi:VirE N-terminal domain
MDKYSKELAKAKKEGSPDPVASAKKAVSGQKKNLPGILFSGKFSRRANNKLEAHSGFLVTDLDNLGERLEPLRQKLKTDGYIQVVFISPTGTGLKVLIRIEARKDSHHRSFLAAKRYFRETYDEGIDNCPDVSWLCYASFDPDIFIRPEDAVLLEPLPEEPKPEVEPADSQAALEYIGPKGVILPHRGLVTLTESAERLFGVLGASENFYLSWTGLSLRRWRQTHNKRKVASGPSHPRRQLSRQA